MVNALGFHVRDHTWVRNLNEETLGYLNQIRIFTLENKQEISTEIKIKVKVKQKRLGSEGGDNGIRRLNFANLRGQRWICTLRALAWDNNVQIRRICAMLRHEITSFKFDRSTCTLTRHHDAASGTGRSRRRRKIRPRRLAAGQGKARPGKMTARWSEVRWDEAGEVVGGRDRRS